MAKMYFENVRIGFKNFSGRQTPYNKKHDRNFVIFLEPSVAEDLESKGLNIKWPKKLDQPVEEDNRQPYLKVKVNIDGPYPPDIMMIAGDKRQRLEGDAINMLDDLYIVESDVEINTSEYNIEPSPLNPNGLQGITAYLNRLGVTINTDPFQEKYGF